MNQGLRDQQVHKANRPPPPGTDGATWYNDTGAPAGSLGVIGDFYLDNDNGWVYKKTGPSTWEYQVTLAIDKPSHSAEQIALLQWYEEGEGRDYVSIYNYGVGDSPRAICFDGTYIWVTNAGDHTVSKVNAATGTVAPPIAVGDGPKGTCFDGTYIWVANTGDDTVSKIDAATGTVVPPPIAVKDGPQGICFDGTHIWVTNVGDDTVSKILD